MFALVSRQTVQTSVSLVRCSEVSRMGSVEKAIQFQKVILLLEY